MCFYARKDEDANKMVELFEKGMNCKLKLGRKRLISIDYPPYEFEQMQLEKLEKGLEMK